MSVSLLDVNVLIALAWPTHVHHSQAQAWFRANSPAGWATCPLTQCGFVRISSNPRILRHPVMPKEALALLKRVVSTGHHNFWTEDTPLYDPLIPTELLTGHGQVVDAYLLGLAIRHKGKLVTLDRGVADLLPAASPHRNALEILPTSRG